MTSTTTDADVALKAKHRAMWALGDYHAVATEIIPALGPVLVEAAGISAGEHVLDVAAGSGNVAIPAAATGAHVIATDLTPELLDPGRAAPPPGRRPFGSPGSWRRRSPCRSTTRRSTWSRHASARCSRPTTRRPPTSSSASASPAAGSA